MATLAGRVEQQQNFCAENSGGDRLSSLACHLFRGIGDNLTQVALPATHLNSTSQRLEQLHLNLGWWWRLTLFPPTGLQPSNHII